ncbi:prephenate dehydratase [Arthrobacter sp. MYb211]|uniref:prephenate dehydratase n=1 Tax=Micrococcaceae TaxID=1268 RepID=UPI000BB8ECA5|nr:MULTISPECIES: prephenate dehydratase [Micrococcaceae]PCC27696.1 prephenate dehydratase [Glutamicibacter sp. BW80]PQZ96570.1 prephenate dehydratase [Arthrobacter sp. MYb224]PRA01969.1 prephenate dehydratase [Arthrobacter sp. MYb229]PRA13146.1 prephenate dehydratase [Arthrobacter sp. MYb221]PRB50478.1 prephenate dehydratase [Arthrobacter sp. MYb216]
MSNKISYQGEAGSNSNIACTERFPDMEAVPCASFEDAFAMVESGAADLAMIPIENSIAGRVADIHVLLPESDLQIVGEHYLRIRFDLLGIPGSSIEAATEVHSHIHALGQCRRLIREHQLTPVIAGDTAGSAREIRDWDDPRKLSLAPPMAAELYGLEVLSSGVEDDPTNMTRFVVLARKQALPTRAQLPDEVITSLVFQVRNVPSALYKALGGFATNGVNLTRMESYMVGSTFAATTFMVDIEGHPEDLPVRLALEELDFFTWEIKTLGTYAASEHRQAGSASFI